MSRIVNAEVQWIPEACGGTGEISVGMRPRVRWQKHAEDWKSNSWDATIVDVSPESDSRAMVSLTFLPHYPIESDWFVQGELIELLEGYRVIGVGQISI